MGVSIYNATMPGAVTPTCDQCGVRLCWDISDEQYQFEKLFWDAWVCEDCNGGVPMSLNAWRVKSATKSYAGIGSRKTPPEVMKSMTKVAARLSVLGWTLRSGAAEGADKAFEFGAGDKKEIFLPWNGFMGNNSKLVEPQTPGLADEIASQIHPGWQHLSQGARKLMARNSRQILGQKLNNPVKFVLCWTPDGCEHADQRTSKTGGTGQAIALATRHTDAPVFNMKNEDAFMRLRVHLWSLN